ncbi:MAG: hypothetical protein LC723_13425 [Actinobacteria bacterium]|nr:hypothetical protein [Actinomycetota bacterium]
MIKLYDDTFGKILMLLASLRVSAGNVSLRDTAARLIDEGPTRWGHGDGVDETAVQEINFWTTNQRERTTLDDILNEAGKVSLARRARVTGGEKTIIDTIVNILKLDTAASVFSGRMLRELRSAILLPSEAAPVLKRLRSRTIACCRCGRDIHSDEVTTTFADEGGLTYIYCYGCRRPSLVKCSHADCETLIEITAKTRFLQEFHCDNHRTGRGEAAPVIQAGGHNPFARMAIPGPVGRGFREAMADARRAEAEVRHRIRAIADPNPTPDRNFLGNMAQDDPQP